MHRPICKHKLVAARICLVRKDWDYIVIGAGTAGCVLAARLSEDPDTSVLLIEAGRSRLTPWLRVPIGYFKTIGDARTDWMFATEPEPGLAGRSIAWPRGKVIGGSGSINGLVYVRGQPEDYDAWRDEGCLGWGWADLLPYFMRAEHQERGASSTHGVGGPLCVSDDRTSFEISERFIDAARAHGIPTNRDCNDGSQFGAGHYQITARHGVRSSTATGHLRLAKSRSNLHIATGALCERILLSGSRAVGVEVLVSGRRLPLTCNREIVLCAGAIGSPHLLMLSGIGDSDHLREHQITPLIDAPEVGQNLQDHLKIHNSYRTRIKTLNDQLNSRVGRARMGLQYLLTRRGPLAMGAAPVFCFARSDSRLERPDLQFHVLPWSSAAPSTGVMDPFSGFTASLCPLRPESRGCVRLASSDARRPPRIQANYLTTQTDRRSAIAALRVSRAICRESPLREAIESEHAPGRELQTDAELLDYVRHNASTIFHPVGTCRMGVDGSAVVDPSLRVVGVDGLRVADASIMPSITSGNTNAPVVAIAEKASDIIRAADAAR